MAEPALPGGIQPLGLEREAAAAYCGMTPDSFDAAVRRASCEDEALLADLATEAARELLGERVMLVVEGRDSFGRILAHVLLEDGRDYGTEMIARGLALLHAERAGGWCEK